MLSNKHPEALGLHKGGNKGVNSLPKAVSETR